MQVKEVDRSYQIEKKLNYYIVTIYDSIIAKIFKSKSDTLNYILYDITRLKKFHPGVIGIQYDMTHKNHINYWIEKNVNQCK